MSPLVYYDQIHLYAKNLQQDKYQQMIEAFDGIGKIMDIIHWFTAMIISLLWKI